VKLSGAQIYLYLKVLWISSKAWYV